MLDSCNLYGTFLYGQKIYSPPECYVDIYDFMVSVYNLDTDALVSDVEWELYRRDTLVSVDDLVDENHILVASGSASSGIIQIDLAEYGIRYLTTDLYLKTWRSGNPNYVARLRIKYFSNDYTTNDDNWPLVREAIQIVASKSSGGMGGGTMYHTEYIDKPIPTVKVCLMDDEEEDKEIWIIDIKDFDSL